MQRLVRASFVAAILLLWAASAWSKDDADDSDKKSKGRDLRVLTDWSVTEDRTAIHFKVLLNGNGGRSLGKVSTSGRTIKFVVDDTLLDPDAPRKLSESSDSVERVEIKPHRTDVEIQVTLKEKSKKLATQERLAFMPGREDTVVEIRKDAYFEKPAQEVPHVVALPAAPPQALPPNLQTPPPAGMAAGATGTAVPAPAANDPTRHRDETVQALFGAQAANAGPAAPAPAAPAAAPAPAAPPATPAPAPLPAAPVKSSPLSLGQDAPDLSNLYLMAGLILLAAGLWFVVTKMRGMSLSRRLDDATLKILKQQSIGGRQRLLLVEAEGKRLLLAASDKDLRLLAELDPQANAEQALDRAAVRSPATLFDEAAQGSEPYYQGRANGVPGHPQPMMRRNPTERPSYFGQDGQEDLEEGGRPQPEAAPGDDDGSLRDRLRSLRQRR